MPTLTKDRIAEAVFMAIGNAGKKTPPRSREDARQSVESLLGLIKKTIAGDEGLLISRFGHFGTLTKRQRMGRNPHTGELFVISARRVPVFRMSRCLRDACQSSLAGKKS